MKRGVCRVPPPNHYIHREKTEREGGERYEGIHMRRIH